jgi:hypothetical protein
MKLYELGNTTTGSKTLSGIIGRMKPLATLLLAVIALQIAPASARTATTAERLACERPLQDQIDAIHDRMRTGYGAREGERLKERLRHLEEARRRCRTIQ